MTWPLIVLALSTIGFSLVLTPAWPWLHHYLLGETDVQSDSLIQPMLLVSLALVTIGVGLALLIYRNVGARDREFEMDPMAEAQPALFRFLEEKMWIDNFYEGTVILGSKILARLSDWMDRYFWDGLVRAIGGLGQGFGILTATTDERGINAGVDETTLGARGLGRFISAAHSGQVQTYLGVLAIGMLALLLLYAWLA
jgi:NADH:ubiquinone oxidoreductase subunit 5 (subunit L)/multisubunit Na+/H+ antiporter MnhA subunit